MRCWTPIVRPKELWRRETTGASDGRWSAGQVNGSDHTDRDRPGLPGNRTLAVKGDSDAARDHVPVERPRFTDAYRLYENHKTRVLVREKDKGSQRSPSRSHSPGSKGPKSPESPDCADAFAFTVVPVVVLTVANNEQRVRTCKSVPSAVTLSQSRQWLSRPSLCLAHCPKRFR